MLVGGESFRSCTDCHPSFVWRTHTTTAVYTTSSHCLPSNPSPGTGGSSFTWTTGWRKVMWPTNSPSKGNTLSSGDSQRTHKGWFSLPVLSVPDAAVGAAPGWEALHSTGLRQGRSHWLQFTLQSVLNWSNDRTWQHFPLLWDLLTLHFFALILLAMAVCSYH